MTSIILDRLDVVWVSYNSSLTWSLKGQKFWWNRILSTERNQIEVLDMSVVISYNTKSTTTAKIGVQRNVGNLLLFCCRMETNQT